MNKYINDSKKKNQDSQTNAAPGLTGEVSWLESFDVNKLWPKNPIVAPYSEDLRIKALRRPQYILRA